MAAISHFDAVTIPFQDFFYQFAKQWLIINAKDLQRLRRLARPVLRWRGTGQVADWKEQPHGGAFATVTFNLNFSFMPFHDSVHHRQPETGAPLAFGREKWFEAMFTRSLIHTGAGIADFKNNLGRFTACVCEITARREGTDGDSPALRQCINGI